MPDEPNSNPKPKSAASVREILKDVAGRLAAVSDSPTLDAELLLCQAIDVPRSYLFAHPEDLPDDAAIDRLEKKIARRLAGEPIAYITGTKEFWSMELLVTPATLVPRPETEVLVERALMQMPRRADWRVLDLGTGSGAIALAIAREQPMATVTAVDISGAALRVAAENARRQRIANVEFVEGDWLQAVAGQTFEMIVSNPPYIEAADPVLANLASEPRDALAAGGDGLDAVQAIVRDAPAALAHDGLLLLEHGSAQQDAVADLLRGNGWLDIECFTDYAGLPRVTMARHSG